MVEPDAVLRALCADQFSLGKQLAGGNRCAIAGRGGAVAALGGFTMFIFIIAIAQAWARGLSIDCGCFGGGGAVAPGETRYLQEILRDAGLVAMALFLIRYPVSKFSIDKAPKQSNAGDTE